MPLEQSLDARTHSTTAGLQLLLWRYGVRSLHYLTCTLHVSTFPCSWPRPYWWSNSSGSLPSTEAPRHIRQHTFLERVKPQSPPLHPTLPILQLAPGHLPSCSIVLLLPQRHCIHRTIIPLLLVTSSWFSHLEHHQLLQSLWSTWVAIWSLGGSCSILPYFLLLRNGKWGFGGISFFSGQVRSWQSLAAAQRTNS